MTQWLNSSHSLCASPFASFFTSPKRTVRSCSLIWPHSAGSGGLVAGKIEVHQVIQAADDRRAFQITVGDADDAVAEDALAALFVGKQIAHARSLPAADEREDAGEPAGRIFRFRSESV